MSDKPENEFIKNLNHSDLDDIIQSWRNIYLFKIPVPEREEYLKHNKVGFFVSESSTKFISTRRHALNDDWTLNYSEIIAIAFENRFVIDDDELFIIFFRKNLIPIYFTMPTEISEEMEGFEDFINKLKEKIGLQPINWQEDKALLVYPNELRGEELYYDWLFPIKFSFSKIARRFGINQEYNGTIEESLKKEAGFKMKNKFK